MFWIYTIVGIMFIIDKKRHFQAKDHEKYNNSSLNRVFWNNVRSSSLVVVVSYIPMFFFSYGWTECNGLCGETGYKSRYRSTTSGDASCEFNREWKTCRVPGCTGLDNYTGSIEGNALRMRELDRIRDFQTNGGAAAIVLDKCISDRCDYHAVENALANDTDQFWNALLCVKHNLGCPVKGGWSEWSPWSKCTATCGPGIQYRLRNCDRPAPSRTSLNCSGDYVEFRNCVGKSCAANANGTWCRWSNWSRCSVRQGNGIVVRKRFCRHSNNGTRTTLCLGPHTKIERCYMPDVDGGWCEWQKWSPCSTKCDKGIRYRTRSCSRPEREGLGQDCTGEPVQTSFCYVEPCKGPPIVVATFDKQSHVKYAATQINSTLLHVALRFYPFDIMSGIILRRFDDNCDDCDSVQLNLIDCRLFLTLILDGCNVTLPSPSSINIGWNEVSFTITKNKITLQLNDNETSKYIKCPKSVSSVNFDQVMNIGEVFEGYIEKLNVNFVSYALTINDKFSDMYLPYATFNTIFEVSDEQMYSDLSKQINIPCPRSSNFWKLELYLRLELLTRGNLILVKSIETDNILSVDINNDIIKLKIKLNDYFDEISIKLELIDSSWIHLEIKQQLNSWSIEVNGEKHSLIMPDDMPVELCKSHFYIGHFEENQNSTKLRGIIGYLKLDDNILNPNDLVTNPSIEYNMFSQNLIDTSYNEILMTNEDDIIELTCIINNKPQYEDLDIAWLKFNPPVIHKMNCNIFDNNCIITTNECVSQITIFPKTEFEDNFYLCISMTKQKIVHIYGVTTFKNVNNTTNILKPFIFMGKVIASITILLFIIIVKKIK